MIYLGIYLLTILDNVKTDFALLGGFALFASVLLAIVCGEMGQSIDNFLIKFKRLKGKMLLCFSIACLTITPFSPTTKQTAFIIIAPHIIENNDIKETFKNIPEIAKLGTDYLKEILKEKIDD